MPAEARAALRQVSRGVWLVLIIALALRVATVAFTWHAAVTLDPSDFSRTAASIANGHGYPPTNRAPGGGPSAFRPPGYPLFLAGVYVGAGGTEPQIGRFAGAVLGTLTVALIGLIALRLWGRRVGFVALTVAAVAPPLVIFSTALISEALFVPVVLAGVLIALRAREPTGRYRRALAAGFLVGIASLTRTNGVLLLLPIALAFVPAPPRRRIRAWGPSGVVVLAAVLTIAPWTLRNSLVFHSFVPISDESGYTLAGTYNQVSRADRRSPALWIEAEHGAAPEYARILRMARLRRWNEVTYGDHLQAQAISEIEHHPAYVLKVAYWNAVRTFGLAEIRVARNNLHDTDIPLAPALLIINTGPLLLVLGVGGLLSRAARQAPRWLWLVPVCLLTSVFVTGFIRFRAPIDPFLVILAALVLVDGNESFQRLRASYRRFSDSRG